MYTPPVRIIRDPAIMRRAALELKRRGRRIGFVPTMGFLHEGHLSLIRLARRRSDAVVVSLFVNPTQFGPGEDLARYPRNFARDRRLCWEAGVDMLFAPSNEAMYPADAGTWVVEEQLAKGLCGAARPGHFRGVCTVVAKLFHMVQPDLAVFGEKDAQQLRVIRRMVRDLDFPVRIVAGPTVREADGLAMSSRNRYLSPAERAQALCLPRALEQVRKRFAAGERRVATLAATVRRVIEAAPLARVEYIALVDEQTLAPIKTVRGPCLVALAMHIGTTRLIDNIVLTP